MKRLLKKALENPLDYPPFSTAVFPGDRVALVPDRFTIEHGEILGALVESLLDAGIEPEHITILFDDDEMDESAEKSFRARLPNGAEKIVLHRFVPYAGDSCSLLCLSENGEPIALARPIVDADVVLPVERHWPVSPVGHFGTFSVLVPRFSDLTTRIRFQALDGVKSAPKKEDAKQTTPEKSDPRKEARKETREAILASVAGEIADAADRLGVAMLLEVLADERGEVTGFLFGAPPAVRARLKNDGSREGEK